MTTHADLNVRPEFDEEIQTIAKYVCEEQSFSAEAYATARWCLLDAIGCALLARRYPECMKLISPIDPESCFSSGARILGSSLQCEPTQAAFSNTALIRWLDYNDTWLAAEWGHPSDNLGTVLSLADYLSRQALRQGRAPLTMKKVLDGLIKTYEIQGILALQNSFNRVGLDHVVLVKVASTAIATKLWGGDYTQVCNAISQAWVDGQSLRTYRHAPNTGSRKSWAAGDATARAVRLAWMSCQDEMGYPSVLTAPRWGFYDVLFKGQRFQFERPLSSYVIENILFKISYPAEFHAQTAVECALKLYPQVKDRWSDIEKVWIRTQEPGVRIISKTGPLYNAADRDHCLQYMVAIPLLTGALTADDYSDARAADPRIDALREKMHVEEDPEFTKDYFAADKRAISNAIKIKFKQGDETEWVRIDYPVGHRRRREEGLPLLENKFMNHLKSSFTGRKTERIVERTKDLETLKGMPVHEFMDMFVS